MARTITVKCPHCGTPNDIKTDSVYSDHGLTICDIDDGGCDKYFAWSVHFVAVAKTAKVEFNKDDD